MRVPPARGEDGVAVDEGQMVVGEEVVGPRLLFLLLFYGVRLSSVICGGGGAGIGEVAEGGDCVCIEGSRTRAGGVLVGED